MMRDDAELLRMIQTEFLLIRQEFRQEIASLRAEIASTRHGSAPPEFLRPQTVVWTPPTVKKLGDLLAVLARSGLIAAREGVDRTPVADAKDVPFDPPKDGDLDGGINDGGVADATKKPDADAKLGPDMNARDRWNWGAGSDPKPKDGTDHAADKKPDAHKVPKKDDADSADHPKRDGEKDSLTLA